MAHGVLKRALLRHAHRAGPLLAVADAVRTRLGVPYEAFDRHNAAVEGDIAARLAAALAAPDTFALWRLVQGFEARFAAACGRAHGVGTGSGTAALQLALVAAGVGPGDEVVTSAHTYIATLLAIHATGARPVLVDPDPSDLLIRPEAVARALTPRTRAIVPVHMHGHVVDVRPMLAFGPTVIEDCAQAHGARRDGLPVPIGPTGCFSFFPSKPLGGAGNGGMIVTDDAALAARARAAADPESDDPLVLRAARTPAYLNALEAAVLDARLPLLEEARRARSHHAEAYLAALGHLDPVRPHASVESAWYSVVVRLSDRDAARARLLLRGIGSKVEYAVPVHRTALGRAMGLLPQGFPVAEDAARRALSLPAHPFVSTADRQRVIDLLR
jgi:dTDP-4-amino-4,6-dideoxygalactose transaminase